MTIPNVLNDARANVWRTLTIIAALVAIFFGVKSCRAGNDARDLALKASNAIAERDTSRAVSWRAQKVLGDSIAAVERLAVQKKLQTDELDQALHRAAVLITRLDAKIQDLNVHAAPGTATTEVNDVRSSTFHVDSTPYHVDAAVHLPKPPGLGTIDLAVRLDTVSLTPRLQCGSPVAGVRPATILVETPKWLTTRIGTSAVDPSACNPQLIVRRDWSPWWLNLISAGAGFWLGSR
jgi:hypothetical protein